MCRTVQNAAELHADKSTVQKEAGTNRESRWPACRSWSAGRQHIPYSHQDVCQQSSTQIRCPTPSKTATADHLEKCCAACKQIKVTTPSSKVAASTSSNGVLPAIQKLGVALDKVRKTVHDSRSERPHDICPMACPSHAEVDWAGYVELYATRELVVWSCTQLRSGLEVRKWQRH